MAGALIGRVADPGIEPTPKLASETPAARGFRCAKATRQAVDYQHFESNP
jgi:hypothetical protein